PPRGRGPTNRPGELAAPLGLVGPPLVQARRPGLADDDADVRRAWVLESRPRRRARVPDVAEHVARRPGRRPAREDHVDLCTLIVPPGLTHVAAGRQLRDLPAPGQIRELTQFDDDVAVDRDRGAL